MDLFRATRKLKLFWQLKMFTAATFRATGTDHCSSEEYRCTHIDACVARTWISCRCVPCHPWCTHRTSLVVKKNLFSFPVAVNNSIKVGVLIFLLQMFVNTESIMKRPVWIINKSIHCLPSVYWVITPLHVSGVSAAHHQEVEWIYVANDSQLYRLPHIHIIPPDDGLQIRPKHVEVW
jgi:hypothetical protein